jgi:hypothetical protein
MSMSTAREPCRGNAGREIVLQLHREPIVHVHLDRHQEVRPHLQDRNAIHVTPPARARADDLAAP